MPVTPDRVSTAATKVNTIGASVPPRHEPKPIPVWSPEGVMELHSPSNMRDLIRHNGWTATDPNAPPPTDEEETKAEADNTVLATATGELTALRELVVRHGLVPDNRWGKKRLMEEIEKAVAAKQSAA